MGNPRVRLRVKLGISPEEIERTKRWEKINKEIDQDIAKDKAEKEAFQKKMQKLNKEIPPYFTIDPNEIKPMKKGRFSWEKGREK